MGSYLTYLIMNVVCIYNSAGKTDNVIKTINAGKSIS